MIKIKNIETLGWEHAIRGMRNPMNSWANSDSEISICECECWPHDVKKSLSCLGSNDLDLMKRLRNAGPDHRKFMRMITVYADITAPLYWWKEFDTYKVGTVANSCSTMHKIAAEEFTLYDFSCEHLFGRYGDGFIHEHSPLGQLRRTVATLNDMRDIYLTYDSIKEGKVSVSEEAKYFVDHYGKKDIWWQMIQLLPSSYNQKRTVMLNYEVLANIYKSRRTHKLDEWRDFCAWIETLPYSEIITNSTKPKEN